MIYFGRMGMTAFDGERWKSWPMNTAYAIRALAFGPDGRLWAGGAGDIGWFSRQKSEWVYHSLVEKIPAEYRQLPELWNVFPDDKGAIFVEDTKVLRWDGNTVEVWPLSEGPRLRAFCVEGTVYVHHPTRGLFQITSQGPQLIIPASVLGDESNRVWWIRPQGDGFRVLNRRGFATVRGDKLIQDDSETTRAIEKAFPGIVVEIPGDLLAIGTVHAGVVIARADGSEHQIIGPEAGLPTLLVNGLFLGQHNQLWVMADSCIARIAPLSASRIFNERSGLPKQPVVSLVAKNDQIAVATENAIYEWDSHAGRFSRAQIPSRPINRIVYTPSGILSSGFIGVRKLSQGEETDVRPMNPGGAFSLSVSTAHPGSYYFSEERKVVRWTPGNAEPNEFLGTLPEIASSFAEDASGHLWIGTPRSGVFHIDTKSHAEQLGPPPPSAKLPKLGTTTIVGGDTAGRVYVISAAGGWVKAAGEPEFKPIAEFPHQEIAAVSPAYASPELWVALRGVGNNRPVVGQVVVGSTGAFWRPHDIDSLMEAGNPRTIFVQETGPRKRRVWIGGNSGVVRGDIDLNLSAAPPRAPLITGRMQTLKGQASTRLEGAIPYDTPGLRFEFAAPELHRRDMLRIESFIDGIDREWAPVNKDASRELIALRDGDYRLLARTVSDTGAVSAPTEFRFRVLAPWWRTLPVIIAFGIGLVPIGYGLFYLRTRALRRHNVELEARVHERTEELESANKRLAAASAAKTEFVASMSHDIRNPLNGIVGLALALEDTKLDGRQREMVATLRECSGYLSTLVDDVLDFASIEAGKIELRPGPLAPGELLRSVVTTLKSDTAERGATLLYEVDSSLPPHLLGDAGRVQQILVNFVSNALKYAGGTIQLSASRPENAPGEVEFAVRDWGQGMNKEEVAALFTKFSRLSRSRQEGITGTGLGLASCRLLADIMGGSVGVESESGQGSRFYLRLPLTVVVNTPEQAPETLPQAAVLLVEDTDYNAWAAKAVLARLGLACDRARTGAEAVRMFEEKRYNVVLLDRNLPDMDGLEVSKRIRASESDGLQSVILAVTAYATAEDRQLCLDAGMDAFVGKPLTPDKLRRTLLGAGRKLLAAATVDLSRPASTPPMSTPSAPSTTVSSEPAELDLGLLTYLSDGTPESFNAQVQRFLETLATTQDELAVALAGGDFEQVKVFAHRVGGQAKMVGFTPLEEASVRLEEIAFQHDANGCVEEADRVRQAISALRAAMARPSRSMSPA